MQVASLPSDTCRSGLTRSIIDLPVLSFTENELRLNGRNGSFALMRSAAVHPLATASSRKRTCAENVIVSQAKETIYGRTKHLCPHEYRS